MTTKLQYSCMENARDRGAWRATVHDSQRVGHDYDRVVRTHIHKGIQEGAATEVGGKPKKCAQEQRILRVWV